MLLCRLEFTISYREQLEAPFLTVMEQSLCYIKNEVAEWLHEKDSRFEDMSGKLLTPLDLSKQCLFIHQFPVKAYIGEMFDFRNLILFAQTQGLLTDRKSKRDRGTEYLQKLVLSLVSTIGYCPPKYKLHSAFTVEDGEKFLNAVNYSLIDITHNRTRSTRSQRELPTDASLNLTHWLARLNSSGSSSAIGLLDTAIDETDPDYPEAQAATFVIPTLSASIRYTLNVFAQSLDHPVTSNLDFNYTTREMQGFMEVDMNTTAHADTLSFMQGYQQNNLPLLTVNTRGLLEKLQVVVDILEHVHVEYPLTDHSKKIRRIGAMKLGRNSLRINDMRLESLAFKIQATAGRNWRQMYKSNIPNHDNNYLESRGGDENCRRNIERVREETSRGVSHMESPLKMAIAILTGMIADSRKVVPGLHSWEKEVVGGVGTGGGGGVGAGGGGGGLFAFGSSGFGVSDGSGDAGGGEGIRGDEGGGGGEGSGRGGLSDETDSEDDLNPKTMQKKSRRLAIGRYRQTGYRTTLGYMAKVWVFENQGRDVEESFGGVVVGIKEAGAITDAQYNILRAPKYTDKKHPNLKQYPPNQLRRLDQEELEELVHSDWIFNFENEMYSSRDEQSFLEADKKQGRIQRVKRREDQRQQQNKGSGGSFTSPLKKKEPKMAKTKASEKERKRRKRAKKMTGKRKRESSTPRRSSSDGRVRPPPPPARRSKCVLPKDKHNPTNADGLPLRAPRFPWETYPDEVEAIHKIIEELSGVGQTASQIRDNLVQDEHILAIFQAEVDTDGHTLTQKIVLAKVKNHLKKIGKKTSTRTRTSIPTGGRRISRWDLLTE